MTASHKGQLIIIGGHEDKEGHQVILRTVVEAAGPEGQIAVVAAATRVPDRVLEGYREVFGRLGVSNLKTIDVPTRDHANDDSLVAQIANADVIFFTGGDQLRITSQIGGTAFFHCMQERYKQGATIVGTSAGSAAMPETMLIAGPNDASPQVRTISMGPGLALIEGVVIDSHFAERGRIGRLLGAVAQNPRNLGLGIDEDTAVVVRGEQFRVAGSGAVYVADGNAISYSSLSERRKGVLSIADVTLHMLASGATFNLDTRQPDFGRIEDEQAIP